MFRSEIESLRTDIGTGIEKMKLELELKRRASGERNRKDFKTGGTG